MIICSNCGATNNETDGNICRKCGALLPISSKPTRIRLTLPKKKEVKPKQSKTIDKPIEIKKPKVSELKEIPHGKIENVESEPETFKEEVYEEAIEIDKGDEREFLTEITPKPFNGSIIASKGIYYSTSLSKPDFSEAKTPHSESTLMKQKQLEEDMTKVLRFLSKKITVQKLPTEMTAETKKQKEEAIPPSSMSEILKELLKLDLHIEASAIIKKDGTILASAISSRMSDSLFATIGQNLSMIGTDIIEGLSAGKLMNISVRGSKGVVDLAPIDAENSLGSDMILIIFSSPRVKSGIINFAANIVKKQVKQYLGLSK